MLSSRSWILFFLSPSSSSPSWSSGYRDGEGVGGWDRMVLVNKASVIEGVLEIMYAPHPIPVSLSWRIPWLSASCSWLGPGLGPGPALGGRDGGFPGLGAPRGVHNLGPHELCILWTKLLICYRVILEVHDGVGGIIPGVFPSIDRQLVILHGDHGPGVGYLHLSGHQHYQMSADHVLTCWTSWARPCCPWRAWSHPHSAGARSQSISPPCATPPPSPYIFWQFIGWVWLCLRNLL